MEAPRHDIDEEQRGRVRHRSTRPSSIASPRRSTAPRRQTRRQAGHRSARRRRVHRRGVRRRGERVGAHTGRLPRSSRTRTRAGSAGVEGATEAGSAEERKDTRAKKLVGLKIGASQIAAAQVVEQRRAGARRGLPRAARARHRGVGRDPRPGDARRRAQAVLRAAQAAEEAACASASRTTASASGSSRSKASRIRAARERDPLPGRGGASDPARPGGARLRRARRRGACRRNRVEAHSPRRRVP